MRATILLLRTRANRDHQRPIELVEIDLLNDRSPQSEQLLPHPERAHVATVPFTSVPTVRSRNRRSTAACALLPAGQALPAPRPHCPHARTAAAVKRREPRHEQHKLLAGNPSPQALLDQTTTAALPRDRVHLTHGTCRGAMFLGGRSPPAGCPRNTRRHLACCRSAVIYHLVGHVLRARPLNPPRGAVPARVRVQKQRDPIIARSYAGRPAPPSRYPSQKRSRSITSTVPRIVHTKWFSGSHSTNDGGVNNN